MHEIRYELWFLDGRYMGAVRAREGKGEHPRLTSVPGEPALDDKGRCLVEWNGHPYRMDV